MMFGPELAGKRIDLVREIRPGLRTVALLSSSLAAPSIRLVRATQAEADRSNLRLVARVVPGANAINLALFEAIRSEGAEAVIVAAIFSTYEAAIMAMANEVALPVIADYVEFAKAGAVLTYGIDLDANVRRAAYFVDRIFRGTKPADLPIEQPTETKLAINLVAAKRFGWTISPSVLARADQVIE
jgi:putative ABC transport system substrate-binding protein